MDFITIEELAIHVKLTRRSIDRKLKALKLIYPARYKELVKKEGKKITYNAKLLIGYLQGDLKPLPPINENTRAEDMPRPVQQKIKQLAEKKPKLTRKTRKTKEFKQAVAESLSPEIIDIDDDLKQDFKEMGIKEQRDMLSFASAMHEYELGLLPLGACLKNQGIGWNTFYNWIDKRVPFASMYARSSVKHRKAYNSKLQDAAKEGLMRMVTGYDKEMASTVYLQRVGPNGQVILIPTERKVQVKHVLPNVNAIMFALTNRDPEDWKRALIPGSVLPEKPQDPLESMTNEQLMEFIENARTQGLLGISET